MTNKSNKNISSLKGGREGLLRGWVGPLLVLFGCVLITTSFFVPPTGVIDPTVLTAFGEILTFAGAVIGIDYKYKNSPPSTPTAPSNSPRREDF